MQLTKRILNISFFGSLDLKIRTNNRVIIFRNNVLCILIIEPDKK